MIDTVEQLEDLLSKPSEAAIDTMRRLEGDILILGAGGKVGPALARTAVRAVKASGIPRRIIAVSTFSTPGLRDQLESWGVVTHVADLCDARAVDRLPDADNVLHLVGRKFGSSGAEWNTWAVNVLSAACVAEIFTDARIVSFSSGNVYPFVPVECGGAREDTIPSPVGEYAMTCLGRERMFDHVSHTRGEKVLHLRLNYAVEMRYGVLLDIATRVWNREPIDLSTGYLNAVWQGYVNDVALRCLEHASSPPTILNITGAETFSVRTVARTFGERFHKPAQFMGEETTTALLSNASKCHALFGLPGVTLDTLIDWTVDWVRRGLPTLDKLTRYEVRSGRF